MVTANWRRRVGGIAPKDEERRLAGVIGASRSIVSHAAGASIDSRFTDIRGRITAFIGQRMPA
jgi:hypothetical protein